MSNKYSLHDQLDSGAFIVAPGCHDALGARILARQGFGAVYMSGNGLSASLLGVPDIGLLTQTEMAERARCIANAVRIPVIADADTGYGNANNVARTVQLYEQAGVGALHLEDQATPKKCGAMNNLALVPAAQHAEKIRVAIRARTDPRFLIIGRSDARIPLGLSEAIRRGKAYAKAGADLVLLEMLQSEDEMKQAIREIDAPMMFNWVDGKTPALSQDRFRNLGFRILSFPVSSTLVYAKAMLDFAQKLKRGLLPQAGDSVSISDYQDLLNLNDYY